MTSVSCYRFRFYAINTIETLYLVKWYHQNIFLTCPAWCMEAWMNSGSLDKALLARPAQSICASWRGKQIKHFPKNISLVREGFTIIWSTTAMVMPRSILLIEAWVTHICVSKLTSIGSDNCLSPHRHQAIILTYAAILSIRHQRTYFSVFVLIQRFSFRKMHLKVSSAKWRLFCIGLNLPKMKLTNVSTTLITYGYSY